MNKSAQEAWFLSLTKQIRLTLCLLLSPLAVGSLIKSTGLAALEFSHHPYRH